MGAGRHDELVSRFLRYCVVPKLFHQLIAGKIGQIVQ
jgi:hypothetical protein